jgi:hypothetical protein
MTSEETVTISKMKVAEIIETLKDAERKLEGLSK